MDIVAIDQNPNDDVECASLVGPFVYRGLVWPNSSGYLDRSFLLSTRQRSLLLRISKSGKLDGHVCFRRIGYDRRKLWAVD